MKFRTEAEPLQGFHGLISHGQEIWTVGSCFSDNIGQRLRNGLFQIEVNPLGTLYNPASICRMLHRVADGKPYTPNDIFKNENLWHCPDFHSSFSSPDSATIIKRINATISRLHETLPTLDTLILTFGSARAFIDRTTELPVGNCHKLPADRFEIRDYTPEEMAATINSTLDRLRSFNPGMNVILTVSPIRHKAYGLHADKISKASLLLACDSVEKRYNSMQRQTPDNRSGQTVYFPAYEIVMDDLRDYRFYDTDMIHPSQTAADYIYQIFASSFFDKTTETLAAEARKLTTRLSHRHTEKATERQISEFSNRTKMIAEEIVNRNPSLRTAIDRFLSDKE